MKNSKRAKAVLLVCVLAVWGVVFVRIGSFVSSNSGADESAGETLEKKVPAPERYRYVADVRDPFTLVVHNKKPHRGKVVPVARPPWVPPPYSLDGIVVNGHRRIAVVHMPGGEVSFMAEGDTLRGLKIAKIWKDSVAYSYDGKKAGWRLR